MDVGEAEVPALAWLDGETGLDVIVARGLELSPPLGPLGIVDLLRRLHRAGLLEGMTPDQLRLVGATATRPSRLARLADLRLFTPALAPLAAPGRLLPRAALPALHLAAFATLMVSWLVASHEGLLRALISPVGAAASSLREIALVYLALALCLSARALAQAWTLRAAGSAIHSGGLRLTLAVAHLGLDLRERRAASAHTRLHVALSGLSALALTSGAAGLAFLAARAPFARILAATASILLLIDLAPYLRTDGRSIAGITARIPDLRRRAMAFLLRRVGDDLLSRRALGAPERRYLTLAVLALLHILLVFGLLLAVWVPDSVRQGTRSLVRVLSPAAPVDVDAVLGVALAATLTFLVLAVLLALVALMTRWLWQLLRPPPHAAVPEAVPADAADRRAFLASHASSVLFADLEPSARDALAAALNRREFAPGQVLATAGALDPWLGVLASGRCSVRLREVSGLEHEVAALGPGDFFGMSALVEPPEPRPTTVVAKTAVSLLTLDAAAVASAAGDQARSVEARVRSASVVRRLPFLAGVPAAAFAELLAAIDTQRVPADAAVVEQGQSGDAVYAIRDGRVAVEYQASQGAPRRVTELGPGEYFGEIAPLRGGQRTATVRALEASVLLRIPGDVFRRTLLTSFEAGLHLEHGIAARLDALAEV